MAFSMFFLQGRAEFDREFKSVALVADYVQLLELAQTENVPVESILEKVRGDAGIDRIALLEDTPVFLQQRGLCSIVEGVGWPGWKTPAERDKIERNRGREPEEAKATGTDWPLLMGLSHDKTHMIISDPEIFTRIALNAMLRYPGLVEATELGEDGGIVSLAGEPKIVLEWGLGFDPELVGSLTDMGFRIYPRIRHYRGYTEDVIKKIIIETDSLFSGSFLIFDGDSSLGGLEMAGVATREIDLSSLNVGWIEFAEQKGAKNLAWRLPERTSRVHSIEDEEMEIITPERAVARYTRAVRERACRILFLKPFLLQVNSTNRIDRTIGMFSDVRSTVIDNGFEIGKPSLVDYPESRILPGMVSIAIALASGLVLLLLSLNIRVNYVWTGLIFIGTLAIPILPMIPGAKMLSLGMAVVAPTLAVAWLVGTYEKSVASEKKIRGVISAFIMWLGALLITIAGALTVAASLVNTRMLLEIDAFSGVKLGLYLPILLAIVIGVRLILPPDRKHLLEGLNWLLGFNIRIWHIFLGIAALVMAFIMYDRSGNFPVISVAEWENDIRGWFETMLYARPRTKEFLIGHPGMLIGLTAGLGSTNIKRAIAYGGIVIGSIGLTSMVNTFCHIHTPISISIFRTLGGVIIGGLTGIILGIILAAILRFVINKISRPDET